MEDSVTEQGMQLVMKREPGRSPRAVIRLYGEDTIIAMNEIAVALGKRPAMIMEDWVKDVHAQMVESGMIQR